MNYLKAVFWDYPQFTEEDAVKSSLKENKDSSIYLWIMSRFLEHGRVVDSFRFFKLQEIAEFLPKLRLTSYTLKKWQRLIEIYGNPSGK
jgi:hypothetical protein